MKMVVLVQEIEYQLDLTLIHCAEASFQISVVRACVHSYSVLMFEIRNGGTFVSMRGTGKEMARRGRVSGCISLG